MDNLSIEAKICVGCWWNLLITTELTFHRPYIIHQRTRKGLDELVEKGYLTVENFNKCGSLTWRPTEKLKNEKIKVSREFIEKNSFPITTE